ncbi:MAG TPA: PDZ domain-containing protein [Vicinamibacteria bacterium]|jgi:membrane-associated protease RseP (regulator of RpoE activity)
MKRSGILSFPIVALVLAALALAPCLGVAGQQRASKPSKETNRFFSWKFMGGGYLGVEVLPMTEELRAHFGSPEDAGVLVARVKEDSPAAAAGIQVGDVLTAVDGKSIQGPPGLALAVREKKAGESVSVDYVRDGAALTASVIVDERDRTVVDLAQFEAALPPVGAFPGLPLEGSHGFVFTPGGRMELDEDAMRAFEDAMQHLEDRFDSDEWKEKMKLFQELDLTQVQERMKEVEERLRKLEGELAKEGKKKL